MQDTVIDVMEGVVDILIRDDFIIQRRVVIYGNFNLLVLGDWVQIFRNVFILIIVSVDRILYRKVFGLKQCSFYYLFLIFVFYCYFGKFDKIKINFECLFVLGIGYNCYIRRFKVYYFYGNVYRNIVC